MQTPKERYETDNDFRTLVDVIFSFIVNAQYTPSELRQAVILASIRHAQLNIRVNNLILDRKASQILSILEDWLKTEETSEGTGNG